MNRTTILFLLFILLGGTTIWYLISKPEERSTVTAWDRDFAVEAERIGKIFIADRRGNKTTLERKDDHWIYNDQWRARPNAMENLLDAISRVEMKYKPPLAAVENMVRNLAAEGIKVEIYDRKGTKIKAYYVGGGTVDERGTYLIMENAENPYVGYIPGWEGNIRFRYNLTGTDWRDKSVFAADIKNIQSVSVEYPKQKDRSFRLQKEGDRYEIEPFYPGVPKSNRPYQEGSAESFLYGFESLVAEAFENDNPRRDSVRQLVPFSVITLKKTDGTETSVRFFPVFEKYMENGFLLTSSNPERYFADMSNGDFMLVQNRVFKSVFWAYDFFFEEIE